MATSEGKKKVAALIVAGMPGPDKLKEKSGGALNNDEDMKDGGADDDAEGAAAASESAFADFRTALASKDDKAGAAALKEFLGYCKGD